MYNVTSLVKSIEEVANNTAPFPTTADHNGLSHFTGVRTSFPTEDMLSMLWAEHPFQTQGDIVATHSEQVRHVTSRL